MKITVVVTSTQNNAKNWVIAALKRNLTGENKSDILKSRKGIAKELRMKVTYKAGSFVFEDLKWY